MTSRLAMWPGRAIGTHSVIALRQVALLLAAVSAVAVLGSEAAVGEKLDPTKRAPISTSSAVQPGVNPVLQSTVAPPRVVRMSKIPVRKSTMPTNRAAIEVGNEREKRVITPEVRRPEEVRNVNRTRAADRPAIIPALDRKKFREMIAAYESGRTPANEMLNTTITVGGRELDIGEINRFANPRRALEAQGIPVTPAASAPEAESDAETVVPYSAETTGGSDQ